MKRVWAVFAVVLVVLIIPNSASAIYLGTCEGYIKNGTGDYLSGITVDVTVSSCSDGCTGSTTTDSNGYYVVANLNLPAGGTVTADASGSGYAGSNSGTADQFQAAEVNVSVCKSPEQPNLTPQADIHYPPEANLSWTSGTGYAGATYDRYQMDSNSVVENATSPQYESSLSYSSHTWKVQTCNEVDSCCSIWASDTFSVYNNPPSQPSLTPQQDTNQNNVSLSWTSGTDPDGDATYDEYKFHSNSIISNATSPQNESGLDYGSYTWRVRTCDNLSSCSAWSTDSFSIVNHPCPAPVLTNQPNTHDTNVTLYWTSNSTDEDGEACHDRYQFGGGTVLENATSPQQEENLTQGQSYTWKVQSCDIHDACSGWSSDSFTITNDPPSAPNLTDQAHTSESFVTLYWTSGTDPNGDATHDEYDFNGTVKNATSPQVEQGLTGTSLITWRVRTCDALGACSSWTTDTFIRADCEGLVSCPACPPCESEGGGGGAICTPYLVTRYITKHYNMTLCNESWVCEDWGECTSAGYQFRECVDTEQCGTTCRMPLIARECIPPEIEKPEIVVPAAIPDWAWVSIVVNVLLVVSIVYLLVHLRSVTSIRF